MNNLHLRRHFSCVSDFVLAKTLVIDVIIEETQKKIAFAQREQGQFWTDFLKEWAR